MARRIILIRGVVQGVGFRPFVHRLASQLGLSGLVRNEGGGVRIEIEGDVTRLDQFAAELSVGPPLARINASHWTEAPERGSASFTIEDSEAAPNDLAFVAADLATCETCVAELVDPGDRRFGYALLNCTYCGPRLTILEHPPYDRRNSSLASFPMCPACRREYESPGDRRYHAQAIACPDCGPHLAAVNRSGQPIVGADPLALAARELGAGKVVALKGLGGYHLACDARNGSAVARLREEKHRADKPFAVMVGSLSMARQLCHISAAEAAVLQSSAAPIVLLWRRPEVVNEQVAPRNRYLGVMLPYTPLHHWLFRQYGLGPLVMTSGNDGDEPMIHRDDEAIRRFAGLSDLTVTHNRPIVVRCDDSVTRVVDGEELPIRRARGMAPLPLALPIPCREPTLAVGGQLKSTFALGQEQHAFVSHHLGDLGQLSTLEAYREAVAHYQNLLRIEPSWFVHDLHPDYASTVFACQQAPAQRRLAVQHHHAHLASCMAENGICEPVIGAIFDGTGYGVDGAIWGGEFLVGEYGSFRRAACLRYTPLPGGESAIRQPWRVGLSHLVDSGIDWRPDWSQVSTAEVKLVEQMIARRFHSPLTSSMGRLFDAVAALLNLRTEVQYEGQAAMELEWLAEGVSSDTAYPFAWQPAVASTAAPMQIDTRPLMAAVVADVRRGCPAREVAQRFHGTLAVMIEQVCVSIREQTELNSVALSGGVFANAILLGAATARLRQRGFQVYRHRRVPPNDGGLSLGQLAIAAAFQTRDNCAEAAKGVVDVPWNPR